MQLLEKAVSAAFTWSISMCSGQGRKSIIDAAKWRGTWELDGGVFMNQTSHYVDLVDWLIGPVEKIQAMTGYDRHIG